MRASKQVRGKNSGPLRNPEPAETHISGAEGLYESIDINKIFKNYIQRALQHPKGIPDKIVLTIEKLEQEPRPLQSLPVTTLGCGSPSEARRYIGKILKMAGISKKAIRMSLDLLNNENTMRGASLMLAESGERVEPDRNRGVRASRLGITGTAEKSLSLELEGHGINNSTVKEAVILASKVASLESIIAELCIPDDPDYTTGYISCRRYGYLRIPNIKQKGDKIGGRVFFMEKDADVGSAVKYLEDTPVLINNITECGRIRSLDEILNHPHR